MYSSLANPSQEHNNLQGQQAADIDSNQPGTSFESIGEPAQYHLMEGNNLTVPELNPPLATLEDVAVTKPPNGSLFRRLPSEIRQQIFTHLDSEADSYYESGLSGYYYDSDLSKLIRALRPDPNSYADAIRLFHKANTWYFDSLWHSNKFVSSLHYELCPSVVPQLYKLDLVIG